MHLSFCLITGVPYRNFPGKIGGTIISLKAKDFNFDTLNKFQLLLGF